MSELHLTFKREDFPERVIKLTDRLMSIIWNTEDKEVLELAIEDYVDSVCDEYNIKPLKVNLYLGNQYYMQYIFFGGGLYDRRNLEFYLFKKPSVMTLLHELRHHMQFVTGDMYSIDDEEQDARAWSHSLFYQARPKQYSKSKRKGYFKH